MKETTTIPDFSEAREDHKKVLEKTKLIEFPEWTDQEIVDFLANASQENPCYAKDLSKLIKKVPEGYTKQNYLQTIMVPRFKTIFERYGIVIVSTDKTFVTPKKEWSRHPRLYFLASKDFAEGLTSDYHVIGEPKDTLRKQSLEEDADDPVDWDPKKMIDPQKLRSISTHLAKIVISNILFNPNGIRQVTNDAKTLLLDNAGDYKPVHFNNKGRRITIRDLRTIILEEMIIERIEACQDSSNFYDPISNHCGLPSLIARALEKRNIDQLKEMIRNHFTQIAVNSNSHSELPPDDLTMEDDY